MAAVKKLLLVFFFLLGQLPCFCWGFFAHQKINYYAVFLLPPQLMAFYKPNIAFLSEHAVDPDKRRYMVANEAPRHFMDMDFYQQATDTLPHQWEDAVATFGEEVLQRHGIAPWWLQVMQQRLIHAFKEKDQSNILKLSAEIGHYLADIHVPLHASSNYNGQLTGQQGIHGFWESRIPELLADKEWDFLMNKATYISRPADFIWKRIQESAAAADTVLREEKALSETFPADKKFAFENRNGVVVKQYASAFAQAYNKALQGMIERRMRQSVYAVASFWYTAWVNAGQPDLTHLSHRHLSAAETKEFEELNEAWKTNAATNREHLEGH